MPTYGWDGAKWTTFTSDLATVPPSTSNPSMDGAANAGSSAYYARGDHVHPADTGRAPINNATFTGTLTAALLNVTTVNLTGRMISTSKGHQFGYARGTLATGAVTEADANVKFYDHGNVGSPGSWCGIGTDTNGNLWVRTGYSGNPAPVFYVANDQVTYFRDSPLAPTPGAGDNSTRLATTAFVMARAPTGKVPLSGGTVTGNLTHNSVDLWVHNNGNYGVIYLGNSGARYLQWDGSNYHFNGAAVYAGQGRIYGTGDWGSAPYNNARLAYVADPIHGNGSGLSEPYSGSTITGTSGPNAGGGTAFNWYRRYRQFQYHTTSWFAIGYA